MPGFAPIGEVLCKIWSVDCCIWWLFPCAAPQMIGGKYALEGMAMWTGIMAVFEIVEFLMYVVPIKGGESCTTTTSGGYEIKTCTYTLYNRYIAMGARVLLAITAMVWKMKAHPGMDNPDGPIPDCICTYFCPCWEMETVNQGYAKGGPGADGGAVVGAPVAAKNEEENKNEDEEKAEEAKVEEVELEEK